MKSYTVKLRKDDGSKYVTVLAADMVKAIQKVIEVEEVEASAVEYASENVGVLIAE